MRLFRLLGLATPLVFLCSACVTLPGAGSASGYSSAENPVPMEDRIVSAKGYGTVTAQAAMSSDQAKLMAMRAAKVDAYRNLAERLQGLRVSSVSNAAAFASQGDAVQTSAEYFLRGARVVSITPLRDGIYEAVVELDLDNPGTSVTLAPAPAPAPVVQPAPVVKPAPVSENKKTKSFFFF
jgi:hypothetical protein